MNVYSIIARASNLCVDTERPEYTIDDFLRIYPQFSDIDRVVVEAWLNVALSSLSYSRWGSYWHMGMGFYMAHFLTLYVQSLGGNVDDPTMASIENALFKGIATSKSVDDMSVSYDFSSVANEADGWGTYKQTSYGLQFVQFAKLVGKGGMTVW